MRSNLERRILEIEIASAPKVDRQLLIRMRLDELQKVLDSEHYDQMFDLMDELIVLEQGGEPRDSERTVKLGKVLHELFVTTANEMGFTELVEYMRTGEV